MPPVVILISYDSTINDLVLTVDNRVIKSCNADRGQKVVWELKKLPAGTTEMIEYIDDIGIKPDQPNNVNIFTEVGNRPVAAGRNGNPRRLWQARVDDNPGPLDDSEYHYYIRWKKNGIERLQTLDPIIAIKPSGGFIGNYAPIIGLAGVILGGLLSFFSWRGKRIVANQNKLLEDRNGKLTNRNIILEEQNVKLQNENKKLREENEKLGGN